MKISIGLVDDHVLLRNGLSSLLKDLDYEVVIEADNGKQFIEKLEKGPQPEVVLMDISMPEMDGYETTLWLKNNRPEIRILALSMNDEDSAVIRMLRAGARGYLLKDSDPSELRTALRSVLQKGYYHSELVSGKLIHSIAQSGELGEEEEFLLTEKERNFLRHASTELTYKEIADRMSVSPRTIDGYRDALFEKLDCKSRVGLVLYAIRNGIVKP